MDPVRFSRLKLLGECPAIYKDEIVKQTACMEQGSAADALVFGTKRVIAYPGSVRRGGEWKAFKAAPENADAMIVTKAELSSATAIAAAVHASPRAMKVLRGEFQKEIFWSYCGRDCVSHVDVLGPKGAFVSELKVSNSSNPNKFKWLSLRMYYHCQHAFYDDAATSIYGENPRRAHFTVCVRGKAPHVVTVFRLTPKLISLGKKINRGWMERLLQCEQADFWPGYSQTVVELDAPDDEWLLDATDGDSKDLPF
jgi:hypothetical protein